MKLTVPSSWNELSAWQRQEICFLLLQKTNDFEIRFLKIIRILFLKNNTLWDKIRVHKLFKQVPVSQLLTFADFLLKENNLYTFPPISEKLQTPAPRLTDCTIKQFSVVDSIFYKWRISDNQLYLRQLVASLYRFKNNDFHNGDLPRIAEITDKISEKQRAEIGFVYGCIREYIIKKYPYVFSSKSNENLPAVAHRYTPFSKVITAMAMETPQPLGNYHDCNRTLVYDFFDVFQENIKRQ